MERKTLYRYLREDGGYTVSPVKPEGTAYSKRYRLIAEEGKAITNGIDICAVIDVASRRECDLWQDCELPAEMLPDEEQ